MQQRYTPDYPAGEFEGGVIGIIQRPSRDNTARSAIKEK